MRQCLTLLHQMCQILFITKICAPVLHTNVDLRLFSKALSTVYFTVFKIWIYAIRYPADNARFQLHCLFFLFFYDLEM